MDTSIAITRLEAAVEQQVLVSGGDTEMEAMSSALLATLEPVIHQIALDLAEQAAAEVSAQLATHDIDVVLSEGEPTLRVRPVDDPTDVPWPRALHMQVFRGGRRFRLGASACWGWE